MKWKPVCLKTNMEHGCIDYYGTKEKKEWCAGCKNIAKEEEGNVPTATN